MRTAYIGPMWSGKSYQLKQETDTRGYLFLDCVNTRNSERDLNNLLKPQQIVKSLDELHNRIEPETLIVIDEVHLYQVFKKTNIIRETLKSFPDNPVSLAGLYHDGYNDNQPFSIWSQIFPRVDQIVICKSRVVCANCKGTEDVFYTMPRAKNQEKIGDNYFNICEKCWIEGRK